MNKQRIVAAIITQLRAELALFTATASTTRATHEENKAEDKYDTRGLEASYLAMGQLKQAAESQQAVNAYESLVLRDFAPGEGISLGAIVTLQAGGQLTHYVIGPRAGGTEISTDGDSFMVITPHSPLGRQLMDRRQGEILHLDLGGKRTEQHVTGVH